MTSAVETLLTELTVRQADFEERMAKSLMHDGVRGVVNEAREIFIQREKMRALASALLDTFGPFISDAEVVRLRELIEEKKS